MFDNEQRLRLLQASIVTIVTCGSAILYSLMSGHMQVKNWRVVLNKDVCVDCCSVTVLLCSL